MSRAWKNFKISICQHWQLYLFLMPTLLYFLMFHYVPMLGVQIAFKDFQAVKGIWNSPWKGLTHFVRFFNSYNASLTLQNTLLLSFETLIFTFPIPVILALMLNQHPSHGFRRVVQTVTYMPHFISIVVLASIIVNFCSPSTGILNHVLKLFGGEPVYFMGSAKYFRPIYIISNIWQSTGWNAIIYLAALSSVPPSLHEAATIDGASRFKRVLHIDLPSIAPTVVIMLIMACGRLMSVGFEKAYLLQTPLNLEASEIISTYVYKVGLQNIQYSYSTAINLFNSVVNAVLILSVNAFSRKAADVAIF